MKKFIVTLFSFLFFAFFFAGAAKAQTDNSADSTREQKTVNQPLKIIKKFPPGIGSFQKCFETQGDTRLSIRLRVTFHSSGKITGAEIVNTSGCKYFDEESVRVAKKIKFEPEIKNGAAATVTKSVEYNAGIR
jgi:TonB family protein